MGYAKVNDGYRDGEPPIVRRAMAKVLIAEDDEVIAQGVSRHLESAGFTPVVVDNGTRALARLRFEQPDVCVLDLMLPGLDGWAFIEAARAEGIGVPIIVVSAAGPSTTACTRSRSGPTTTS